MNLESKITLVGKHCESGDVLVKEGDIQDDLVVGDLLVTPVTGAYGHSMGSNYNKVLRPAVVFVQGGKSRLVLRRRNFPIFSTVMLLKSQLSIPSSVSKSIN